MANHNDPAVIAQDFWTVAKLSLAVAGLYIWEFFTTLDYEWSVIQQRRPYRWTIWLYSLTRVATLMAMVVTLIILDVTTPINCQLTITFGLIFSYIAIAAASMLIVLRVIAIWNRNKIVSAIAISTWTANVATLIRSAVLLRGESSPVTTIGTCNIPNTTANKLSLIMSLCTDIVLLLIMLVGLLRWRNEVRGEAPLARFLWTQGLIWFLIATVSYFLPVAFISLNINAAFNVMFQNPSLITLSIAATRMYRTLTDFGSRDMLVSMPKISGFTSPRTNQIRFSPMSSDRPEVVVHIDCERYVASQTGHCNSYVITDDQQHDKPHGRNVEDDVESSIEKWGPQWKPRHVEC
ncbi:hypothetical protein F5148DRAFT_1180068 [Russula earlei]|uniref:Uncharacterized protein n=1 Tax=Russula earlei TaxID=71964 RepID=A0ACC0UFB0_9AGAM|nr:hypothetical protein F5148DRAFT_1180068 [Russula earlei]